MKEVNDHAPYTFYRQRVGGEADSGPSCPGASEQADLQEHTGKVHLS